MKYIHIARELFNRTRTQATFSANDIRAHGFHEAMESLNDMGAFFRDLQAEGLAIRFYPEKAKHPEARGRWIWSYTWTSRARARFLE